MAFEVSSAVAKVWNGSAFVFDTTVNRGNIAPGAVFQLTVTFSEAANTAYTPIFYFNSDENPSGVLNFVSGAWSNGNKSYTITYSVSDDAGFQIDNIDLNVSARPGTSPFASEFQVADLFSVDLVLPTADVPTLISASDTGISDTDGVTKDTTPTFRVALPAGLEVGDRVNLFSIYGVLANLTLTQADLDAGDVEISVSGGLPLGEGTHEIYVDFRDDAGNETQGQTLSVTIDSSVTAPTVDGGNTPFGDDVVLTGTASTEAGAITTVTVDGADHVVTVDGSGVWELELGGSFGADGLPIPVSISTTDLAGNTSAANGSFTVGLEGDNVASSTAADETFALDAGRDTVVFLGNFADSDVTLGAGTVTVSNGADGEDTLSGVEVMQFADTTVLIVDATPGYEGFTTIQSAVAAAAADTGPTHYTILVRNGNYNLTSTLSLSESISIIGESEAGVQITAAAAGYGIDVTGDDVSLSNFTLKNSGSYGIKVQPNSGDPADRLLDFELSSVTVQNSAKTEVDLNGVIGAKLTNVTANGNGTAGVGIAITDSQDVVLENISTSGNNWGSVALYPTNTWYDSPINNIEFVGTYASSGEAIGLFVETLPGAQALGDVSFPPAWSTDGDGVWTVSNAEHRADDKGDRFTFYFANQTDAANFAALLESANGGNTNSVITDPEGIIHGTAAVDTLHIDGDWADFTISEAGGVYTLVDNRDVPEYADPILVTDVANFAFTDGTMAEDEILNDGPTGVAFGPLSVAEDVVAGTVVGAVTGVTDADGTFDSHTYALVNGDGRFVIDADTGVITVAGGAAFNYEAEDAIELTVEVTDAHGLTHEEDVTVSVGDVNEAPSVSLVNIVASIDENSDTSVSIKVADIVISDDAMGTETLSLSGAHASLFEIVGGELRLKAGTVLDHETLASLDVTVNVNDATIGGAVDDSASLTLAVANINEAPTFGFSQTFDLNTDGVQTGGGNYGNAGIVPDGMGGIFSPDNSPFAWVSQTSGGNQDNARGPYSYFEGKHTEFADGLTASTTVYLNTGWGEGEGFDYSVSVLKADGSFLRDFIFHVSKDTTSNALLVGGSNNTNFTPRQDLDTASYTNGAGGPAYTVANSGWYTLQHTFKDVGGKLAVELSLLDVDGNVLWSVTKSNVADSIAAGPGWPGVGGVNYGWFVSVDVGTGIAVNALKLGEYEANLAELVDGDANEDTAVHTATGKITFQDVDAGDSHTVGFATPVGALGSFDAEVVNADGERDGYVSWSFSVADAAIDHLKAGETLTQIYALTLTDAGGLTATRNVTVTIVGTDDEPLIGGEADITVDETDSALTINGVLTIDDADADQSAFVAATDVAGSNGGTFSIDADGNWTYEAVSAHDTLAVGQSFTSSFTAVTVDGTEQVVTVTIEGTNDAPVIAQGAGNTGTAWETSAAIENLISADTALDGKFDLTVDYSATIIAQGVPESRADINALIAEVMADGAGEAEAIAAVWDYYDDSYGGYSAPARDESVAWLGVYYVDYLSQNKQPLTFVASKYTADNGDSDGFPQRLQLLHDNLLGNLWWQDLEERLDQKGTTTTWAAIIDALTDVDPSLTGLTVTRFPYSGNQGVTNTAAAYDISKGLVPLAQGQLVATDVDSGDTQVWTVDNAQGLYGELQLNSDGSWSYVLDENLANALKGGEVQTETFDITVTDLNGLTDTTTITIDVIGTNDVATITASASEDLAVLEAGGVANGDAGDAAASGTLIANDADGDENVFADVDADDLAGLYGDFLFNSETGEWSYTLDQDKADALKATHTVVETLVVKSLDGTASYTISVNVTGANDNPVAVVISNATAEQDQAFSLTVDAFSDADLDALTYSAALEDGSPLPSWLSFDAGARTFSGTPANGDIATLTVKVTATDPDSATASASFELAVGNVNDAPELLFSGSLDIDEDETVSATFAQVEAILQTYVSDIDGDDVKVTVDVTDGAGFSYTYVYPDDGGPFALVPPANFHGDLSVVFTLDDGQGEANSVVVSDPITLTVNSVVDLTAGDDAFNGVEDNDISGNVADNDSTTSLGSLAYELVDDVTSGVLDFNADGTFVYTPTLNESGSVTFSYKVIDEEAGEDATRTVTLTIAAQNDDPTHSGNLALDTDEDACITTLDLLADAEDVEADGLSVSNVVITGDASGVVVLDSCVAVNPAFYNYLSDGQQAVVTITYTITDCNGGSVDRTATITIDGHNELLLGSDFDDVGFFAVQGSNYADTVHAGDGDDTVYGASGDDELNGDDGDDTLHGGSGNDRVNGGEGRDTLYGGSGNDTFVYLNAAHSAPGDDRDVIADYTSADKFDLSAMGDFTFLGKGTASRTIEYGNLKYYTTGGNTYIVGDVDGDGQSDFQIQIDGEKTLASTNFLGVTKSIINGTLGNDVLNGTLGNDTFLGGRGLDQFNGGAGSDTYVLLSTSDSPANENRDVIISWDINDKIDMSAIDADPSTPDNEDFLFVGQGTADRFVGAGQIKYYHVGGHTYVAGDTNGDGEADFQLKINGIVELTAENFVGVRQGVILGTSAGEALNGTNDDDIFVGGLGRDVFNSGLGADTFVYATKADSAVGGNRDVIKGWDMFDVINLSAIDANSSVAGSQNFVFDGMGTADTVVEQGHLKAYQMGGSTFVVGNSGADNAADFQIEVRGLFDLTSDNFEGLL